MSIKGSFAHAAVTLAFEPIQLLDRGTTFFQTIKGFKREIHGEIGIEILTLRGERRESKGVRSAALRTTAVA